MKSSSEIGSDEYSADFSDFSDSESYESFEASQTGLHIQPRDLVFIEGKQDAHQQTQTKTQATDEELSSSESESTEEIILVPEKGLPKNKEPQETRSPENPILPEPIKNAHPDLNIYIQRVHAYIKRKEAEWYHTDKDKNKLIISRQFLNLTESGRQSIQNLISNLEDNLPKIDDRSELKKIYRDMLKDLYAALSPENQVVLKILQELHKAPDDRDTREIVRPFQNLLSRAQKAEDFILISQLAGTVIYGGRDQKGKKIPGLLKELPDHKLNVVLKETRLIISHYLEESASLRPVHGAMIDLVVNCIPRLENYIRQKESAFFPSERDVNKMHSAALTLYRLKTWDGQNATLRPLLDGLIRNLPILDAHSELKKIYRDIVKGIVSMTGNALTKGTMASELKATLQFESFVNTCRDNLADYAAERRTSWFAGVRSFFSKTYEVSLTRKAVMAEDFERNLYLCRNAHDLGEFFNSNDAALQQLRSHDPDSELVKIYFGFRQRFIEKFPQESTLIQAEASVSAQVS